MRYDYGYVPTTATPTKENIRIKPEIVGAKHKAFYERLESGGKAVLDKRHTSKIVAKDLDPGAGKMHLDDK
jgi:hypothetical protein